MKKKLFFVLMICVLAAVCVGCLAGCGKFQLDSPRGLRYTDDGYFAWNPVEGAEGYVVYFNDDLGERYYTTATNLSVDNPDIRGSLISGEKNRIYIRAVTMKTVVVDKKTKATAEVPDKISARSLIIFNYSRQLATPNKIKMNKGQFSWRGVTDAVDYKALVRRSSETEGTLYDMEWATGAASVNGTVKDLPNGYMYYVSIVATAPGYENSAPSDEVPLDRTGANMGSMTYQVSAGDASFLLTADPDDENRYVGTVTAKEGDALSLKDNAGTAYTLSMTEADRTGDYTVDLDLNAGSATVTAIDSYYLYVNGGETTTKLQFNAVTGVYVVNVTLKDGDNFLLKNGAGELVSTYDDASVNQGTAVNGGEYAIRVLYAESGIQASVTIGATTDTGNSKPEVKDGKWPVSFDYDYAGAPAATVVYVEDGGPVPTPATPVRSGYTFDGWYEDTYHLIQASFGKRQSNFAITAPTTFYAKWTKDDTVAEHTTHVDADNDGKCDVCGATVASQCTTHVDTNNDGKCDRCGATVATNKCTKHVDRDGDGKCDTCGVAVGGTVPVDTTATLYFDLSDFAWWANDGAIINAHIWYADNTNNTFPGPAMTYDSTTGYYKVDYYSSRTIKGVLFTRNNPNPKPEEGEATEWDRVEISDFTFSAAYPVYKLLNYTHAGDYYNYSGRWIKVGEVVNTVGDGKIYLDFREIDWFMDSAPTSMVYIWYTDGSENAKYPGKAVTYTTDATSKRYSCYVDYFTDKQVGGVIFTRNAPDKEPGSDEGVWNKIELNLTREDGSSAFDPAKPAYRVTALGTSFDGYWETEAEAKEATANVVDVVDGSEDLYLYLNASAITWFADANAVIKAKFTYTDGSVSDVEGKAATVEDGLYRWGYADDRTVKSVQILRLSPDGELWNTFTATPTNGIDPAKNVMILSNFEDNRAAYRFAAKAGAEVGDETRTVYFTNNKKWTSAYGYAWTGEGDGKLELAAWPGIALTKVDTNGDGDDVYSFTLSLDYENIIFNGMGGQTVNIALSDLAADKNAYYCLDDLDENGKYWYGTWYKDDAKSVKSIAVAYTGGDVTVDTEIDKSEVTVTATYSDDTTGKVTGFTLSGYDKSTAGAKTVTVSYVGKTATFEVTYVAAAAQPTERTIYFTDNYGWGTDTEGKIYCYAFKSADDTKYRDWPGEVMTYSHQNGENQAVYKYTLPIEYDRVVFKKYDADTQTVDVTLGEHNGFYLQGWTDGKAAVGTWDYNE